MEVRKKKIIVIILLAIFLITALSSLRLEKVRASSPYTTTWWNSDWHSRKLVKLQNGISADYQLTFVLAKENGYDYGIMTLGDRNYTVIDCENSCANNFSDIRLLDRNNNPLSYYIEDTFIDGGNHFAVVTVRVTSSTFVNATTGYMWLYYAHNGAIASASNPYNTYYVYEDCEDGNLYDDYNWITGGDGIFYVTSEWAYPSITQNLHAMTPHLSGSSSYYSLRLNLTQIFYPNYIPINISLWATAKADPNSNSFLEISCEDYDMLIKSISNATIVWEKYSFNATSFGYFDIKFNHDGSSTYDWEAGAFDNVIIRSAETPAPNISIIYSPETNVISYNMYPVLNSTNISVNNTGVLTSINVTNIDNNSMNITFYAYNYTSKSWDIYKTYSNVLSGNYSAYIPPAYCHNYTVNWYVIIHDNQYNVYVITNVSYFTLRLPSISNPSPSSGSRNLTTLPLTLSINVSCQENVTVKWYYYNFSSENWTLFATNTSSPAGTFYQTFTHFDGNPVNWYVNVTGDITQIPVLSDAYNFTMKSPIISNPNPPSGSENVSFNTTGVNTSINVSSYENVNVYWYYYKWNTTNNGTNITGGEWIEYGNETNITNGSYYKYFPYSYLNSTSFIYYYWMVKAVGVDTNTTSYEIYNFTKEYPKLLNPIPSDGAENISISSSGVNTSIEINTTTSVDLKFYWYDWQTSSWKQYGFISNVTGTGRYYAWNSNFTGGNMRYYWNVTVVTNGTSDILQIGVYNFTTISNVLNISSPYPTGNVSLIENGINTSIYVGHIANQNVNITWYWYNYTGNMSSLSNWNIYAKDVNVSSNHSYYHQNSNFTLGNTTFIWAVLITEVNGNSYIFKQYEFNTTQAISISNLSPANNETNVTITSNGVLTQITINHSINHTMDIEWYYSDWIKNGSSYVANWVKYGSTYNVSNGTYSKYLNISSLNGLTTYYWYVRVRENLSSNSINSSYVPYTYSPTLKFTTEYEPVNVILSPSYNSTVNITSNGVLTSAYFNYSLNTSGKVDVYWYYYDWNGTCKVYYSNGTCAYYELPSSIQENDSNWKLYGTNYSVALNQNYSQWLSIAKVGSIPYYWMVKVKPIGETDFSYTNISLFYTRTPFYISSHSPSGNIKLGNGGITTSIHIIHNASQNMNIKWYYYNYSNSNWTKYAEDNGTTGTYSHICSYFNYSYKTYYWMVNVTEKNLPQVFAPLYYQFSYNFTIATFNFTNPIPIQNATSIQISNGSVKTQITLSSDYNNSITIYWYYYDYDLLDWVKYGENDSVSASGTYSQILTATKAGWTYCWRVAIWEN